MSHKPIEAVRLLPRHIPTSCSTYGCNAGAENWVVCPDGLAITKSCPDHTGCIEEYADKLGVNWRLEPIYHDKGGDRSLPRGEE